MAKENLSYVIKRIISFFHTPQHDAVHIEKTRSMGMVSTLSLPSPLMMVILLLLVRVRIAERNKTNYSLHVLVWLFQRAAQSWFAAFVLLYKELFIYFASFSDRILIEVPRFRFGDHCKRLGKRRFVASAGTEVSLNQCHHILVKGT